MRLGKSVGIFWWRISASGDQDFTQLANFQRTTEDVLHEDILREDYLAEDFDLPENDLSEINER